MHNVWSKALLVCIFTGRILIAADQLPNLPVKVERICDNVSVNTIQGWQSGRLLKIDGKLYATASMGRPDEKPGDMMGSDAKSLIFRREPDGRWKQMAAIDNRSYTWSVSPGGTFWIVGPTSYYDTKTIRTRIPSDFNSFEQVYNHDASSYLGTGISPEGSFLLLHAESKQMEAFVPNAVISAFYDCSDNKWYQGRLETPEGRYGYEGILVRGKTALAVLNSSIHDPNANPNPPHYSWRFVRLARCDDLTKGQWISKLLWKPRYGDTVMHDFIRGPDGLAYLEYSHRSDPNSWQQMSKKPLLQYIARIHDDLQVDVFPIGIQPGCVRILIDSAKTWYLVGHPALSKTFHLWKLDDKAGFKPVKEYELPGTEIFDGYMIHTLRPERFGGQSDGDTVHLMTTRHIYASDKKKIDHAELWHACFDLPKGDK
jgi:hypothetical protein